MGDKTSYEELIGNYDRVIGAFREVLVDVGPERERFSLMLKLASSNVHGVDHWVRVGLNALVIAHKLRERGLVSTPCLTAEGALEQAVLDAAFFHDSSRMDEGFDFTHGANADRVWRHWAERTGVAPELSEAISQALRFHVNHPSVDPAANEATICLCNADRLDRVRLGESPASKRMYDDGCWRSIAPHSKSLLLEITLARVERDLHL